MYVTKFLTLYISKLCQRGVKRPFGPYSFSFFKRVVDHVSFIPSELGIKPIQNKNALQEYFLENEEFGTKGAKPVPERVRKGRSVNVSFSDTELNTESDRTGTDGPSLPSNPSSVTFEQFQTDTGIYSAGDLDP
jgi:hypothetical protein